VARPDALLATVFVVVGLVQMLVVPIADPAVAVLYVVGSTAPLAWRRTHPVGAALASEDSFEFDARVVQSSGEIVTGLLFADESVADLHEANNTCDAPLNALPYEKLCPGAETLNQLQDEFR